MALIKDEQTRAEGYGYYSTYGADASDVLGYIESDISDRVSEFYDNLGGKVFKVTIIVEQQ